MRLGWPTTIGKRGDWIAGNMVPLKWCRYPTEPGARIDRGLPDKVTEITTAQIAPNGDKRGKRDGERPHNIFGGTLV